MASGTRHTMIEGAARLLAQRGLQETSFSEVLELTGAPRGSIYHHFPDGKDQLVAEAIDLAGARAIDYLDRAEGYTAEEVTAYFLTQWREVLARSEFQAGCSVLAVTVATDSKDLLVHAAAIFRAWRLRLAALLESGGLVASDAHHFATVLIAAAEGAVVMSRAEQSMDSFVVVADLLAEQVARLAAHTP